MESPTFRFYPDPRRDAVKVTKSAPAWTAGQAGSSAMVAGARDTHEAALLISLASASRAGVVMKSVPEVIRGAGLDDATGHCALSALEDRRLVRRDRDPLGRTLLVLCRAAATLPALVSKSDVPAPRQPRRLGSLTGV